MKAVLTVSRDIQVLRVGRRAVPDETAWQDWAHFTDTEEELATQSLFGKQAAHKEVQDSIVVTHGSQRESELQNGRQQTQVILLGGGIKKHLRQEIETARSCWQDCRRRKRQDT